MKNQDSIENQLLRLEQSLLEPEVRSSAEKLDSLLADDFIEFGSSGRVYDKGHILRELPLSPPVNITIMDFRVRLLGPDLALVTYLTASHDGAGGKTRHALRGSIWRLSGGGWQIIFHQGTPCPPLTVDD